jgi:predicted RNA-binding Zn-ribbon protein involved in translation (DUF1610 family)
MTSTRKSVGPWTHRLLIYCFTGLFAVLVYWLLGFIVTDIATWPGPDYQQIEKRILDQNLIKESASLQAQIDETNRAIANRKQRQAVLRDSTSNSEKTMNQLLELQKLTLRKGVTPSADEVKALSESQRLFLTNQTKYQEMNDQIATLSEQLNNLQARQRDTQSKIEAQRPAVQEEYNRHQARHQLKLAVLKLAVLVPLLGVAVWLFFRMRASLYAPLVYGFGLALLVRVVLVIHEHFPTRYFKYILITAALLLVGGILVYLLLALAFPKLDWLLKQCREAYEHFLCPVCGYPIRRGALKYLFWTRSSLKKLAVPTSNGAMLEEPYVCPVCSTRLFEMCESCKGIRHSLLPACDHCGAEKSVKPQAGTVVGSSRERQEA